MRLAYTRRALRHIQSIHDFIARDDPQAAQRVVERIFYSISRLTILPHSGRPSRDGRTRILSVPGLPYVVIHRIVMESVAILAVFHTARGRRPQ